jgi:protein SCO1/2
MKTLATAIALLQLVFFTAATSTATFAAPACCSTNSAATAAQPFTDQSIYQVASTWTSDYGKSIQLAQLRGRIQIVTLFFTSCNYACPILVNDLKKIEAGLAESGLTNASFVLVTMDLERDTIERLHDFRKTRSLDDNWLLLRGESDDLLELAVLLGVKYKKETNGQFAHSNIITLLNEHGEIVHQQLGLNTDPAPFINAVKKLQKKNG